MQTDELKYFFNASRHFEHSHGLRSEILAEFHLALMCEEYSHHYAFVSSAVKCKLKQALLTIFLNMAQASHANDSLKKIDQESGAHERHANKCDDQKGSDDIFASVRPREHSKRNGENEPSSLPRHILDTTPIMTSVFLDRLLRSTRFITRSIYCKARADRFYYFKQPVPLHKSYGNKDISGNS